jgi:hypothetical protein
MKPVPGDPEQNIPRSDSPEASCESKLCGRTGWSKKRVVAVKPDFRKLLKKNVQYSVFLFCIVL